MRLILFGTLVAAVAVLALPSATGADDWTSFEFDSYNREYVNLRPGASWETSGPLEVRMRSPAHRLRVFDHRLDLRRRGDGTYDSRIRVRFSGDGDIVAEVGMGSAVQRLEDHVHAPDQEVEVLARLGFREVEAGYEIEAIELPPSVTVRIESELGTRMVTICQTAFAFLGIRCGTVEAMFSRAAVPLPDSGGLYFLSSERLSRAERLRLSRFLRRDE